MSQAVLEYSRLRADPPWAYRSLSLVVPAFAFGLLVFLSALESPYRMKYAAWGLLSLIGILLALLGLQKPGNKWWSVLGLLANLGSLLFLGLPNFVNRFGAF
jgi:hypothetical protein